MRTAPRLRGAARLATLSAVAVVATTLAPAQPIERDENPMFGSLEWRAIGPGRGGRAQSVSGVVGDPNTYYMGATGGGVWKTTDAGASWRPVSDGFLGTGSVGDVAVAPSDPNVVYVGMGEADIRGNFSHGDGVYRSTDAGKTWEHVGLEDTRQIGRIEVHPTDPDTVYVAALGHVFGENRERGVFRSTDGGESWEKILYVDDKTGAVDVEIDPNNPRVLYAGMWQVSRTPWRMDSGGEGSGLYRSLDGGDTWEELTEGLPEGVKGKIGVSASRAQRDLVYAIVEAEKGGVFRSTDGGESWRRVSEDRNLRQRAWYYSHIYADPQEPNTLYVMNVRFHKSIDGGRTWSTIRVPHADNHDLWIDPFDNQRMVNANDGGANVSFNGGRVWTDQTGQPTAQFYRVTTDNRVPYRVYGAQQDNSTASVSSRGREFGNWQRDLYAVGGGESGYIAVHPEDPDIIYAGSYGGTMSVYDHSTGVRRSIMVWPENPMGGGADVLEHRFQWTFPIVISPHDPERVYVGGERLFVTTDRGQSYEAISPDLTTNDKSKQASSGGPITQDNTSVEYYCTIFTVAESPLQQGLIWVGTDDGLIHVTNDAGETWNDVTPRGMPDWPMISLIEASPHNPDVAYAAVNRYKMNDFKPYVYKTTNRGRTWKLVSDGIDDEAHVRSVREDPMREGLLYAGTELGVYVSLNAGEDWEPLQQNLPVVPVTDVTVKDDDLVIATQGRSFWIMDDLSVLRSMPAGVDEDEPMMLQVADAYRAGWDQARVHFHVPEAMAEDDAPKMSLRFVDAEGDTVRSFAVKIGDAPSGPAARNTIALEEPGMNRFLWNFRMKGPVRVPGAVAWPPHPPGPRVAPGTYTAQLLVDGEVAAESTFGVLGNPNVDTTPAQYAAQAEMLDEIYGRLSDAHTAVNEIRAIRKQVDQVMALAKDSGKAESLKSSADALKEALKEIEEEIIQTRSKSSQDPLNFPIKLNDKIGALAYQVDNDFPPTEQAGAVLDRLGDMLAVQLAKLDEVKAGPVAAFNELVEQTRVPAITAGSEAEAVAAGG